MAMTIISRKAAKIAKGKNNKIKLCALASLREVILSAQGE
jgi:hypothetical protein